MCLSIRTLGSLEVLDGGGPVAGLSTRKPRALLVYLATHAGVSVSREKLAGLLWGDQSEESARTNLRQCLSVLRRAIHNSKEPIICNAAGAALYARQENISLDITRFEALCESADSADLESARALYRGPFLDGFSVNAPDFEHWIHTERQRLEIRFNHLLRNLLQIAANSNNHLQIIDVGSQLILTEPYDESLQKQIIESYLATGQRSAALQHYERFREILQQELGITPDDSITRLIDAFGKDTASAKREIQSQSTNGKDNTTSQLISLPSPKQMASKQAAPKQKSSAKNDYDAVNNREVFTPQNKQYHWRLAALAATVVLVPILFMRSIDTDNKLATGIDNSDSDAVVLPSETPRLAILPLRNINGDDSQNYFSDGLTEDLITDLSRVSGLTVISSTTSFAYKDSTDNPGAIASQLGVDYLLLGSVQRDSNRVRISMRLVDAMTDSYHWTARYEHHMQDIFQLQDQVVRELVDALSITLTESEHALITETTEVDPQAYDLLLQGLSPLREFSVAGIEKSRQLFLKALEIEPDYARAHANLALGYGREVVFRLAEYQPALIRKGLAEAQLAEDLNNTIPQTEFARGVLHLADRNHQAAVKASERAIELDPEYADGFALLAQTTAYTGRLNQALQAIRRAKSLNPKYPFSYLWVEGHILYLLNQFDEALPLLEESNERNPTFLLGLLTLTATYAQLEQFEDADWINQEILSLVPDFSSHQEGIQAPYKLAKHRELYIDGLLKAGLPD